MLTTWGLGCSINSTLKEVIIMIVKISVENFKSFDQLVELNMISSSKIRSHQNHRIKIKQTRLLRNAVVYGANAAGKSNLVQLVAFIKWTVQNGLPSNAFNLFCRNRRENEKKDSFFEIQFTVNDKFYAYGFTARLSELRITSEWLYELKQDGSAKRIYERDIEGAPVIESSLSMTQSEKNKFKVYSEDYDCNGDTLFLTEMNRKKKYPRNSKLRFFSDIYNWIQNNIVVLSPNTKLTNFEYYYDVTTLDKVNKLLSSFDTGISEVTIKDLDLDEFENMIPKQVFVQVIADIKRHLEKNEKVSLSMRSDDAFFNIVAYKTEDPKISTICLKHGTSLFDFEFKDESDGTRRIFDLMDMILSKKADTVYVVDELERSLHPKLTAHFLELFMQAHADNRVQLIFSTHEDTIMDLELFRRDEIWFVERDKDNASKIYSLDMFKERYDTKLSKAYLEGRYGAIPVFRQFTFQKGE